MNTYRTFQSRISAKQEPLRRKALDNVQDIEGQSIDVIHIQLNTNKEGDIISHTVTKADVINIVMPPLVDISYRKETTRYGNVFRVNNLVNSADEKYEVRIPHKYGVDRDDLIIKVFVDPETKDVYVLPLQVIDTIGTFGNEMIISTKYVLAIYAEAIPDKLLDTILLMAKRRMEIEY